jgi:hypothetical protein
MTLETIAPLSDDPAGTRSARPGGSTADSGRRALTRPNETRVSICKIAVAVNAGSRAWQKYLPAKHGIRSIQNDES